MLCEYQITTPIIEYFMAYLDECFLEDLTNCYNIRSVIRTGQSIIASKEEMMTFIGCSALLSCSGYPRIKTVWGRSSWILNIVDNISRDRFLKTRNNLKDLNDNDGWG
ncbi:piggyBac transposable element-derived protein 3 [Trichonephila clavata]|uniref:PiggyBac transposable element-derived protein 3 n=1 Tax=Trichonephila clavata TaxID=2740835 RepID=A0A8X6HH98_TRICU|nr:piggyBac transposable element-derived protein 3 [Trichonephila clavata]